MSPMMGGMNGISGDSYSNSLRGLSGLSGFDRDGMIKTMTLRSRSRIAKYKQKLQTLNWKQEAMRGISDKLIELSRKYLNITSENSLIRESTFKNYQVTAFGEFKDKITAMGSTKALEGISILGISNVASDTTYIADKANGNGGLITPEIDLSAPVNFGALEGKTLDIRIGNKDQAKDFEIKFVEGNYDIYKRKPDNTIDTTPDGKPVIDEDKKAKVVELFRKSFKGTAVNIGSNHYTMDDFLEVDFVPNAGGNKYEVRIKTKSPLGTLNSTYITGGSAFKEIGMNPVGDTAYDLNATTKGFMLTETAEALIGGYTSSGVVKNSAAEMLAKGGSMVFELNGVRKTITFPKDVIPNSDPASTDINVKKDGIIYNLRNLDDVVKYLNQELKTAYGKDAVVVSRDSSNKITFLPKEGAGLTISEGGGHLVGEDNVFRIPNRLTNRLDLTTNLKTPEGTYKSELIKRLDGYAAANGSASFAELLKTKDKLEFNINGNKIEVKTKDITTLSDLIDGINNPKNITDRGQTGSEYNSVFNIAYDKVRDSFVFTSKDKGAGSVVDAGGLWNATSGLETALFGNYNATGLSAGKDAKVFYKTAESSMVQSMVVHENDFTINEAKFHIKDGFNVQTDSFGNLEVIDSSKNVTFGSKIEADKLVETVKNMIKDYNDLVKLMGKQFKTLAERGSSSRLKYEPLTEEQRNKMSEKEIEKWEEKAKEGLLFGDPTLRGARDDLAGIIYYNKFAVSALRKIGITQSTYSTDPNATLEFDESKFRAALAEDPEKVKTLFLGDGKGDVGFSNNLKNVIAKHASDTGSYKGSLVEVAGSKYAPGSIFTNHMFKEIDSLKKTIDFYEKRLKNDEDRYIKRFSHLEKIMKKAEMQSGYIMNLQGY